ncbi:hypothetical protein KQH65_12790 [archaeon]|nr:hypothetical protein [archaeon]
MKVTAASRQGIGKTIKYQIPNHKLQTSTNDRISKFETPLHSVWVIGYWDLSIIWNLVLDIWDFKKRVCIDSSLPKNMKREPTK